MKSLVESILSSTNSGVEKYKKEIIDWCVETYQGVISPWNDRSTLECRIINGKYYLIRNNPSAWSDGWVFHFDNAALRTIPKQLSGIINIYKDGDNEVLRSVKLVFGGIVNREIDLSNFDMTPAIYNSNDIQIEFSYCERISLTGLPKYQKEYRIVSQSSTFSNIFIKDKKCKWDADYNGAVNRYNIDTSSTIHKSMKGCEISSYMFIYSTLHEEQNERGDGYETVKLYNDKDVKKSFIPFHKEVSCAIEEFNNKNSIDTLYYYGVDKREIDSKQVSNTIKEIVKRDDVWCIKK